MSAILKNVLRLPSLKSTKTIFKLAVIPESCLVQNVKNMGHMSQMKRPFELHPTCKTHCTRNSVGIHTKGNPILSKPPSPEWAKRATSEGEKELAEFLNEEIAAEKKLQKAKKIPQELNGFSVKMEGSEIVMKKQDGDETVEVCFNINHSVDTDTDPDVDPSSDKPESAEMKSRPDFEVEIKRGNSTLGFTCSMVAPSGQPSDDGYNDLFAIDEVVMYEGDWKETNYSVSGEVLDGTLYDLLMNLLEDKGVNNDFIEKVVDFSTAYEHSCYINMLENIQKFAQGNK